MKSIFALILLVSVATTSVWAQHSAIDNGPASREEVLKLFDLMHLRNQMKLVMTQISAQMRAMSHEQLRKRDPQITDEEIAKLDTQSDELLKAMPIEGMLDDMVPVYQKHLSKGDVDAMMEFYSSPTGQKILKEMPAMTAEGMQAVQPRLRKMMDDAMDKIGKMAEQYQAQKPSAK